MVRPGQIWENGRKVVKLQESENSNLLAITFILNENDRLLFSHSNTFDPDTALNYVLDLGCQLSEKKLSVGS